MIRIAVAGPSHSDSMPAAKTPSGRVPMHIVTIPMTRERIAAGASIRKPDRLPRIR